MDLAPIALFVYNRPWHTEKVLEALENNILASESTLYIICDGPKENSSVDNKKNITKVRDFVKSKLWCKETKIIERKKNIGLAKSVINGVGEIIKKHGKIIVLEDDIVVGRYFLKYMNDALNVYEDQNQVFGISGFKYPTKNEIIQSTYFLPIGSSWGYATWFNRWNIINYNGQELLEIILKKRLKKKMNFGNHPFYEMLIDQINGKNDSWAIRFYASMLIENGYFLFPNRSLVNNIGFDNSGMHCVNDEYYKNIQGSNDIIDLKIQDVKLRKDIVNLVKHSFKERNSKNTIFYRIASRINKVVKKVIKFDFLKYKLVNSRNEKYLWKDNEYFDIEWKNRIKLMAKYIKKNETVTDFGCGQMWLKEFLDGNIYYPVDYVKRDKYTYVCDFNKKQFPPNKSDIAFVSGCLEYIIDFKWFVERISVTTNKCILSYCTLDYFPDLEARRTLAWKNHLTRNEIISLFKKNKFNLVTENLTKTNNHIFVFKK